MKTFFTADTHFWHKNVIQYCSRPWASVEEMNAGLIANWNSVVSNEDVVWILGDFAFCGTKKLVELTGQLKGIKRLIIGNHDWANFKTKRFREFGFESASEQEVIQVAGIGAVKLCHFPYLFDHQGITPRYMDKRPKRDGGTLFHGHIHNGVGSWKVKMPEVNVGVDVWGYKPITAEEIIVAIAAENTLELTNMLNQRDCDA
jgi:calcineurin-like phosphoesterase family protein